MIRMLALSACLALPLPALAETAVPQSTGEIALSFAPVVKATGFTAE